MFRRASIGLAIAAAFFLAACIHKPATNAPAQPAVSVEQQVYADLFTAQTAIEGVKAQAAQFPDIAMKVRTQINQAIASYNTAEKAFSVFESAKAQNLQDPTSIVQIQAMVLDLENQIVKLGQAFSNSSSPTPVKAAQ
jgi:hypothetical protein